MCKMKIQKINNIENFNKKPLRPLVNHIENNLFLFEYDLLEYFFKKDES